MFRSPDSIPFLFLRSAPEVQARSRQLKNIAAEGGACRSRHAHSCASRDGLGRLWVNDNVDRAAVKRRSSIRKLRERDLLSSRVGNVQMHNSRVIQHKYNRVVFYGGKFVSSLAIRMTVDSLSI